MGNSLAARIPALSPRTTSSSLSASPLEILGHELIVLLSSAFQQHLAVAGDLAFSLGWHRPAFQRLPTPRLLGDQVHHAGEALSLSQRHLERYAARAEHLAQLLDRACEVGIFAVQLVDEEEAGQVRRLGHLPVQLSANLDPRDRVDDEDGGIRHPQRFAHFAHEVGVAGCIEEVDLVITPLAGQQGEGDRNPPALFVGVVVGDGVPFLDPCPSG
ncbi:MAG: hypothetical protein KatS3mg061_1840 [Dehalococcoidia bacterium]|nr:MAG: hypothetical protein KatS3mg061_1840 [Dehalococcoidia bacterium]